MLSSFILPLLLIFSNSSENSVAKVKQKRPENQSGTLEKMMVASGSVAMDVDLNRLNGISSDADTHSYAYSDGDATVAIRQTWRA